MSKRIQGQQSILILGEGAERVLGRDAQQMNIMAARAVGEIVKSTLGPKGMDKMLVDSLGDIVITGDGVTILKKMEIEHPAAKLVVEVAKTQEDEVGDGTTTAVVLTGELLRKSEELLRQNIHPAIIANGYRLAAEKSQKILESLAKEIAFDDETSLAKIAKTSMQGRVTEAFSDHLSKLIVSGVRKIQEKGKNKIDIENIKVEKKAGGSMEDSELVDGIVIDKEKVHAGMPSVVENAKIATINCAIEIEKTETDAAIRITSPDQLEGFMKQEEKMIKDMVEKVKKSGATVLLCQKGIDDVAQHYFAKQKIFAVRRVKESDMTKLAKATGSKIISNLSDMTAEDLGFAKKVEEVKLGGEVMTFIRGCKDPKAVTLLIRGGTEHIVDEAERSVSDAIKVVAIVVETHKALSGGGASEIEIALQLRKYAPTVGGREQLAIEAFADSMEVIPRSLAENGGLDPIDMLVELKSAHEKGNKTYGVDVMGGKIGDLTSKGILEPLKVKTQAIKSASETAIMILKIDDVIAASNLKGAGAGMPPGGMPEM